MQDMSYIYQRGTPQSVAASSIAEFAQQRGLNFINAADNQMAKEANRSMINELLASAEGRNMIAASMQQPLRQFRDYTGVGRRLFVQDTLGQGEMPYYDIDISTPAFVVAEEETDPIHIVRSRRVSVPLRELATNLVIPFTELRERRFDLQARVKEKANSDLILVEDQIIFNLLRTVAINYHANPIIEIERKDFVDPFSISEAISNIEIHGDIKATSIVMNPYNFGMFRRMPRDFYSLDQETSSQLINIGYMGRIFNTDIFTSRLVGKDEIFVTAEPEFFGRFIVAQDITVLNADEPKNRSIGFSIFEQLGIMIYNPKALSYIRITD